MSQTGGLGRAERYSEGVIDGRPSAPPVRRWRRRIAHALASRGERDEAEVERVLIRQPVPSRPNVAAVFSPRGGVGKTTSSFVIGCLLADRLRLRVVALDADPDFGTLGALVPEPRRCRRSVADLLTDIEQVHTAADLRRYMSALPSGLHLLTAPHDPELMAGLGPNAYGELLALLGTFYELVLVDLGTGVAGPLAQFAISRADQLVLVTTPEWVASPLMREALMHLERERITVACNRFYARGAADLRELERRLRERGLQRSVAIPHDERLASMLDTGTYQLEGLERASRLAIKRLALAVAEQLV